jgi:hypothetical protein
MIGYKLKTVISPQKKQASFRQKTDANRNIGKYPIQKKPWSNYPVNENIY